MATDSKQERPDIDDRLSWQIGSVVSVHSRSKSAWIDAKISETYVEEKTGEEWLVVKYADGKKKPIQRMSTAIKPKQFSDAEPDADWDRILQEIKSKNTAYVKELISSRDIGVNAQHPQNGKTLLIYAVIIGNLDLAKGPFLPVANSHI